MADKTRVILGCMTFGPKAEDGARITSLDDYKKALDYFQSKNYDEIDTARSYVGGEQEGWSAQAGWKERGLKIATKCYPNVPGTHKAKVLKESNTKSLEQLKTDSTDIFYLHAPDRSVPFPETLKAIDEMYKEGKFKTFALSNFTAAEVAEVCMICKFNDYVRPTLYQAMYNALARMIEPELVPTLRRFGIDIVIYNPIAGGVLSGKLKTHDVPKEGRFSDTAGSGANYRKRYFKDEYFEAVHLIEEAIKPHGLTMVETALRWCVHHSALQMRSQGGNDGIITGVSSFEQLESNLNDLEKGPLPEDVVKALDKAWYVVKPNAPNYWHLDNVHTKEFIEWY